MSARGVTLLAAALLFFACAAAGCGKGNEAEADATALPPAETAAIEAQIPPAKPGAGSIQDRLEGAVHPELTAKLHMFVEKHGRMPENFYELANVMMDSVPPLPPGMKYIIDEADKSVKVAKKDE